MRMIVCTVLMSSVTFVGCDVEPEEPEDEVDGWSEVGGDGDRDGDEVSNYVENQWCIADAGLLVPSSGGTFLAKPVADAGCGPGHSMGLTLRLQTRARAAVCPWIDLPGEYISPIYGGGRYVGTAYKASSGWCYRTKVTAFGKNDYSGEWCSGIYDGACI